MQSPSRVPFGLRSYATESESGSWSGSDLSPFPTDSDADSEFHCDPDLPGFEGELSDTPKNEECSQKENPLMVLPPPVKESWSEIDERARKQEEKLKETITEKPVHTHPRHPRGNHKRSDSHPLSRAERSECWRSKGLPKRRPERKRPDKRRPRMDPPLKGAVVRPYTLPSGPITVLRRPTASSHETVDSDKVKSPGTSDVEPSGFIGDNNNTSSQDSKENDHNSYAGHVGSNARVVNTRFGEGFVVENPPSQKIERSDRSASSGKQMKVARNAAMAAMAGLSMRGKDDKETESRNWEGSISAETYDRSLGGHYKPAQRPRNSKRSEERLIRAGMYSDRMLRGTKPRPNVFIGRRPKLETRHLRDDGFLLGE